MISTINRLLSNILPLISRERQLLLKTCAICKEKRKVDGQGVCGEVGGLQPMDWPLLGNSKNLKNNYKMKRENKHKERSSLIAAFEIIFHILLPNLCSAEHSWRHR